MRLNRVLLLAATINILIFALVLTISCSGENGARGNAGKEGCVVKENNDGNYDITCVIDGEEEYVGTMWKNGVPGPQGPQGAAGENCWLGPLSSQGYEILCGSAGTSKGYTSGCAIEIVDETASESTITCGKNVVSLCGAIAFNPKEFLCTSSGLVENSYEPAFCGTDKKEYNPAIQYCGWAKGDDPADYEAYGTDFTGTTIYDICGPKGTTPSKPYEDDWSDDRYCRYYSKTEATIAEDGLYDFCNGQRYNENSWKSQYCGFETATSAERKVLTGACDEQGDDGDTQGPNRIVFGQGYCEVQWDEDNKKPKKTTVYSEALCGANGKPNDGKWKGEYCGHASASSPDGYRTKVWTGLCDDGKGPHYEKFNDGYCAVDFEKKALGKTELSEAFCDSARTLKPNEGSWKNEYCGVDEEKKPVVYDGLCGDGSGPNQEEWNPKQYCVATFDKRYETVLSDGSDACEDGTKPNEGSFKYEYCGYAAKKTQDSKTTKRTGGCDDGGGPDQDDFGAGYCTVTYDDWINKKGTSYTDEYCGNGTGAANKMNEGSWKKQYCGYANKNSEEQDKVYSDMCDDGNGPFEDAYPATPQDAQYCSWESEDATGTSIATVGCGDNGTARVNEGSWKGQYCFTGNSAVGTCTAGLVAITNAKSTDDPAIRCMTPITQAACKRSLDEVSTSNTNFTLGSKGYFNQKCFYEVASAGGNELVANKTSACPTSTNNDATLYVDCAYRYSTASTAITSAICAKSTRLNGKPSTFYQATKVRVVSMDGASDDFTVTIPTGGVTGPLSVTNAPICVSRNTVTECTRSGNGYVVEIGQTGAATETGTGNNAIITIGNKFTVASAGRCEFTPKSAAFKPARKK